jgi:hypothetical protein
MSETITLYHGTNRSFSKHSLEKSRTELNNKFQGDWICYTPSESVAWKYANAARNQCIEKESFFEETENYLNNNFPDEKLNLFIIETFKILMNDIFDEAWDIIPDKYSKAFNIPSDVASKHFFDRLREYETIDPGFDFNDFYDVLEFVEHSKFGKSYDINNLFNVFNKTVEEIPDYVIKFLKPKGYEKSIPEPKIIKSDVTANNILKTDSREEAKEAREKGYDLVIYSGPDCVDDAPEYLIANVNQIAMREIVIAHKDIEYIDESNSEWIENISYETIKLNNKNKIINKIKP